MRKLLWLGRLGFVSLALVLLPADTHDARLSGSVLCAAEGGEGEGCAEETGSFCITGGKVLTDHANRSQ